MKNYYDILGVNEQSTSADITKAFKDLAKQHHPDRGGTQEKFQEINEAHDTLKEVPNTRSSTRTYSATSSQDSDKVETWISTVSSTSQAGTVTSGHSGT
jgi:curved DNA-binding protein